MEKMGEGEISKQVVEPGLDVSRTNDQLIHHPDPEAPSDLPLDDKQEDLSADTSGSLRVTLRSPLGKQIEITCTEKTAGMVKKALLSTDWELYQFEGEALARAIEQLVTESTDSPLSRIRFYARSASSYVEFVTAEENENEIEHLFESAGWELFSVARRVSR